MSTPDDGQQPDQDGRPPAHGQGYGPPPGQGHPQGYGQGYPQGYGQGYPQGQPGGYRGPRPDHPQATTSLVLGILGLVLCQVISPFAWKMGQRTVAEIDASGGQLGGRGAAQAGYICGLIGTILLGLALAFVVLAVVFLVIGLAVSAP